MSKIVTPENGVKPRRELDRATIRFAGDSGERHAADG
jgi:hypothetical protein